MPAMVVRVALTTGQKTSLVPSTTDWCSDFPSSPMSLYVFDNNDGIIDNDSTDQDETKKTEFVNGLTC